MPTFTERDALTAYIVERFEDGSVCDLLCVTLADGRMLVTENIGEDAPLLTVPDDTEDVALYILEHTLDPRYESDIVLRVLDGVVTRSAFTASAWQTFIRQRTAPVTYTVDVTDAAMLIRIRTHFRWLTRLYDNVTYADYLRDGELHVFLSADPNATRDRLIDLHARDELEHAEVYQYSRYENWSLTYRQVRPRVVTTVVYESMNDR